MRCIPVPVDDEGVRVDALARSSLRAVVVTPAHQFPTGVVTSPERRHALLDWASQTDSLVTTFTDAKYATNLSTRVLVQATLADFLASGEMDRHIRRMASRYRTRRDRLVDELGTQLPDWQVTGTAAGLHLLLMPPTGHDEARMAALAQACGLDARPLSRYAVGERDRPGLVVGYGHSHPDALTAAVRKMARRLPGHHHLTRRGHGRPDAGCPPA